MARLPAYCQSCGCLFQSSYGIGRSGPVKNITFRGNLDQCPNCRQPARVLDGVFEAVGDVVRLIDGPQLTRDILEKFGALVAQAQRQQITPDDLEREATKLDPKLGEAVAKARASGVSFWTGILLLALAALHSCQLDAKLDLNRAFDQLIKMRPQFPASPPASSTPGEE
jgi:hypothetical protein